MGRWSTTFVYRPQALEYGDVGEIFVNHTATVLVTTKDTVTGGGNALTYTGAGVGLIGDTCELLGYRAASKVLGPTALIIGTGGDAIQGYRDYQEIGGIRNSTTEALASDGVGGLTLGYAILGGTNPVVIGTGIVVGGGLLIASLFEDENDTGIWSDWKSTFQTTVNTLTNSNVFQDYANYSSGYGDDIRAYIQESPKDSGTSPATSSSSLGTADTGSNLHFNINFTDWVSTRTQPNTSNPTQTTSGNTGDQAQPPANPVVHITTEGQGEKTVPDGQAAREGGAVASGLNMLASADDYYQEIAVSW